MPPSAEDLIARLGLRPHPEEGGWFAETYRAGNISTPHGARAVATQIYYLLTPATMSAMHKVAHDEMFHFYLGDAVEQLRLFPDGRSEWVILGQDVINGQAVQSLVPAGVWQGARLLPGGRFALMGCTVAPGFDFADYEHGARDRLAARWPGAAAGITALTRDTP